MNTEVVLQVVLAGLNHLNELAALYAKAKSEGRDDLTTEEVAMVRGKAVAANDALQTAIDNAMPKPPNG